MRLLLTSDGDSGRRSFGRPRGTTDANDFVLERSDRHPAVMSSRGVSFHASSHHADDTADSLVELNLIRNIVRLWQRCANEVILKRNFHRSTQPGHPFVGRCNEYHPKGGDALRLGVKAGMVPVWVAGKTV